MQSHECRIKLAVAGEHLSIVRVAIYVAYLMPMYFAMQHKESIPEHLLTNKFSKVILVLIAKQPKKQ
jgi:hypothetical protein